MSKRIDCTVFLLTPSRVVRADFAGRQADNLVHFSSNPRSPDSTQTQAIRSVAETNPRVGSKTILLDTAVWSQLISVPRLSVLDVDQDELHNALKFEMETLTGVDSSLSIIGASEVVSSEPDGDEKTYWVNVAGQSAFIDACDMLKSAGAKWVGLSHPCGIASESEIGKRVEIWDGQAYVMEAGMLVAVYPGSSQWFNQLGFESREQLAASGVQTFDSESATEDDWKKWIENTGHQLESLDLEQLPVIVQRAKTSPGVFTATVSKLIVAALLAVLCLAHWNWLNQRCLSVATDIITLKKPAEEKQIYDAELAKTLEQRAQLEQDSRSIQLQVKQVEFLIEQQTERLDKLLMLLSESRTPDLVIREIEQTLDGLVVKGFSLNGNSVALMANRMREQATPLGWHIQAPTQTGEKKMSNGGPWQFTMLLKDIGPGQPQPSPIAAETTPSRPPASL